MKENTAKIGDGHDDDRSGNESLPCRWPVINYVFSQMNLMSLL